MKTSFIWFDLGLTLLQNRRVPTYRQALQEHGTEVPEPELDRAFHLTDKQFMREYPGVLAGSRLTWTPWYLGVLHHRLGLKLPICPLAARWAELQGGPESYWRAFDFAPAVLDRLRARGLRLGVISNWDSSARMILSRQGILERFETLIISSEVGCEKPDERIFRLALEAARLPAAQCLYVGDNYYDDAVGAARVGMPCLVVNRFGRLGIEEIDAGQPVIRDVREVEQHLD